MVETSPEDPVPGPDRIQGFPEPGCCRLAREGRTLETLAAFL